MFVDHVLFLMSGTYSLRITSGTCWKSPVWGILDYQIILNSHLWKLVGHLLPSISTVLFYLFSFFFMTFCCYIYFFMRPCHGARGDLSSWTREPLSLALGTGSLTLDFWESPSKCLVLKLKASWFWSLSILWVKIQKSFVDSLTYKKLYQYLV